MRKFIQITSLKLRVSIAVDHIVALVPTYRADDSWKGTTIRTTAGYNSEILAGETVEEIIELMAELDNKAA